jgi:hypothetical protein
MSDNYSGLQQGTVTPLVAPPEAGASALDRLYEAMVMAATIVRPAGDCYRLALRLAMVVAPFHPHGPAVEKLLAAMLRRLEMHLATLPQGPMADPREPPGAV